MKNSQIPKIPNWKVLINLASILENPLIFHKKQFDQVGDSFQVSSLGGHFFIITRDADFITHILQRNHKNYEKSSLQTVDVARYIGKGLLTTNGDQWLTHRRMIQPGFGRKKLLSLFETINIAIKQQLSNIENGTSQDVYPLMSDLAFQVVAQGLFSNSNIRKRMARLQQITYDAQQMLIKELRQPYLKWWFNLSGRIKKHLDMGVEARQLLMQLVDERRASGEEKDDLLDMLLSARYEDGEPMSDQQLMDEVLILFTAGHETTANALSFVLFHIAINQEVQEKAYQVVQENINLEDNLSDAFSKLSYIKYCIEEAMRLYPPAYIIDRVAIDDDVYNGTNIPKGTMILSSIYEIQRDDRYWTDSLIFDPERFEEENKQESKGRYYPFGAGPRMCVGNHFAMFEMMLTIYHVLKKYRLSTSMDRVDIVPLVTLKPKKVNVKFELRG